VHDFFLWGSLRQNVCRNNLRTLEALHLEIRNVNVDFMEGEF
jgi:hypothetical protein